MSEPKGLEDFELPRRFGGYLLLAELGRGGMGDVYLALREGLEGIGRRCVVKTLRAGFAADREYVTRFLDEARVVVQLHHRNICPVFDVGKAEGLHYLAMEYIAGRDLRTVRRRASERAAAIPAGVALFTAAEVLEALDYAHRLEDPVTGQALHLVHRDVSPHNVMLGFEGDVRLIDFGLAASTLKLETTAPNVVMGKVGYMAQEQLCGEQLDGRADQYSAAVLTYELYTGERFFEDRAVPDMYALGAAGGFRPARFASLPDGLRAVLDRALATRPEGRFPTCAAMRTELEAYRRGQGLHADGTSLRELMQQLFADDIMRERQLLTRVGASSGPVHLVRAAAPPANPATAGERVTTDTQTLALDETHVTLSVPSAATIAVVRVPKRRFVAPFVAATAAFIATAALLLFVLLGRTDDGDPLPPIPALAAAPAEVAPAPPPPAPPAAPEVARAGPPPDAPVVAVEERRAKRVRAPHPPPATAPPLVKFKFLKARCARTACAPALLAQEASWVGLEGAAYARFVVELDRCLTAGRSR